MAKRNKPNTFLPSVWDRLTDEKLCQKSGQPLQSRHTLADIKGSIRRDLENLLNSRIRCSARPHYLKELAHSLISYGLPDFSSVDVSNSLDREQLRRAIEDSIRCFEPRLVDIQVDLLHNDENERVLHFRISGELDALHSSEPVAFDSSLEPVSHRIEVSGNS
ncbi:MAG: type VI secretion system baseplate subunit TssE [Pirellulales bacterium]|nr:type VI secretion system baseplate subunit TssE [Pirellulales bacterium]